MFKKIRNIVVLILAVLILIIGTAMAVLYIYRNEAIALFVEEANKYIETPVEVKKIELELWENFPMVSFKLEDVKIYESDEITMEYLCDAEKMLISFDLLNIVFKNYEISTLKVSKAAFNIGRGPNGEKNYDFIRNSRKDSTARSSRELRLPNIILEEVQINYLDKQSQVSVQLETDRLSSKLKVQGNTLDVELTGAILKDQIDIQETTWVKDQLIGLESDFTYDLDSQLLRFEQTELMLNDQQYILDGEIYAGEEKWIDLDVHSVKNNMQALVALLPQKYRQVLADYKSKGEITFNGKIMGAFNGDNIPAITAEFSCRDVEFYYPGYKKAFRKLNFTGNYSNGNNRNLVTSSLEVKGFSGFIGENEIRGDLHINNFRDISTTLDLAGNIDLSSFLDTFPVRQISSGEGEIEFDIKLTGKINDLKNKKTNSVKASGDLLMKGVSFTTAYNPFDFRDFNGRFSFNNLDLAIERFSGKIGKSDFAISGFFKNIIPYIFYRENAIKIVADLESANLNLNELLTLNFSDEDSEPPPDSDSNFHLDIPPKLDMDFNCVIGRISFKRFNGERASGKLRIRNQIAVVEDLNLKTMGGDLALGGSINAASPVKREFLVDGKLSGIHIDSIFYVFNDFNQEFLMSHHLQGQIFADVNTYFVLDDRLKFYSNTLTSFIEARILGGELIDFEPMQNLSKFVREKDLAELHFSELQNDIQIKDRQVIIPEMEIISNAYHIYVSGIHTFDQDIDYHFRIPLDQFRRPDRDARYGDIEDSGSGPPSLFLKMQGTATDYIVSLDSKAVKDKIRSDLKEEGNELKELLKKRSDTKEVELEEDEYFEF